MSSHAQSSSSLSSITLSGGQQTLIVLLSIVPTILSIFGSSTIIYMVICSSKNNKKKLTPYKRLLFGMSVCDILCTWIIPFGTLLLPKETSPWIFASGNDITCTAYGFFAQILFSAMLYNGMISYYFLLTVRFGYKEETIAKYIEPIMHFIAIVYPFTCATIGVIFGVYRELDLGPVCWVDNYTKNCEEDEVNNGTCVGPLLYWIFGGSIIVFILISLLINNVLIYCFVRKTILQTSRTFLSHTILTNNTNTIENNTTTTTTTTGSCCKTENSNATTTIVIQEDENQKRRIQLVATQAFLYVGGFFLSYIWALLLHFLDSIDIDNSNGEGIFFLFLILQAIFHPLQGFFNLLIYIRPSYIRTRKGYPNESKVWAIRRSIFGEDRVRASASMSGNGAKADSTGSHRRWRSDTSADATTGSGHRDQIPLTQQNEHTELEEEERITVEPITEIA